MNRVVPALSDALRYATRGRHERLHEWMARADPFASRERYRRYLRVQHAFLDCAAAYGPALDAVLLEPLVWRCMALDRDLADLGASVAATSIPADPVEPAHALGWLYVSEGSTLGAALLLREATEHLGLSTDFGARHLAAPPAGRAESWRRFRQSIDAVVFDATQRHQAINGACVAFDTFASLLGQHFELEPNRLLSQSPP
ncbi:MAG: biliverdin-producing heme oxygenase [Gammaproteobacteria bacterium]|nr:biliverdin-producing heme oxygenase [Gammaproteobacteria bacterium]